MRNSFLKLPLLMVLAASFFFFVSCSKEQIGTSFEEMIGSEEASLTLPESGFDINITDDLVQAEGQAFYTEGTIEYAKNGQVLAKVDFGDGTNDEVAEIDKEGDKEDMDIRRPKHRDCEFEKVIVEPVVKTDDCEWPVSGIVELYKEGEWIATIDFGDGTCDNLATKTTEDGVTEFELKKRKRHHGPKDRK